jgi:hypothetical protein
MPSSYHRDRRRCAIRTVRKQRIQLRQRRQVDLAADQPAAR